MKRTLITLVILLVLNSVYAQFSAQITTALSDLGNGRWQYSYDITNTGTESIEEITIWFDYSDFTNFAITTADAGSWSEVMIEAEDLTMSGAGYDILNTTQPLGVDESIDGFSVAFDYNGSLQAPSYIQTFEIVNSSTYATLYTSQTVPEPATFFLLAVGGLSVLRKRSEINV